MLVAQLVVNATQYHQIDVRIVQLSDQTGIVIVLDKVDRYAIGGDAALVQVSCRSSQESIALAIPPLGLQPCQHTGGPARGFRTLYKHSDLNVGSKASDWSQEFLRCVGQTGFQENMLIAAKHGLSNDEHGTVRACDHLTGGQEYRSGNCLSAYASSDDDKVGVHPPGMMAYRVIHAPTALYVNLTVEFGSCHALHDE